MGQALDHQHLVAGTVFWNWIIGLQNREMNGSSIQSGQNELVRQCMAWSLFRLSKYLQNKGFSPSIVLSCYGYHRMTSNSFADYVKQLTRSWLQFLKTLNTSCLMCKKSQVQTWPRERQLGKRSSCLCLTKTRQHLRKQNHSIALAPQVKSNLSCKKLAFLPLASK